MKSQITLLPNPKSLFFQITNHKIKILQIVSQESILQIVNRKNQNSSNRSKPLQIKNRKSLQINSNRKLQLFTVVHRSSPYIVVHSYSFFLLQIANQIVSASNHYTVHRRNPLLLHSNHSISASSMRNRRKLNTIRNSGQSQEKGKSIDDFIEEGIHVECHSSFSSTIERSSEGKKTRGYTHMRDVWDMPAGDFIIVDVDSKGNPLGWEGKTLFNAIGSLVRRHQCAPIIILVGKTCLRLILLTCLKQFRASFDLFLNCLSKQKKY